MPRKVVENRDEIDLIETFSIIWKKKSMLFLIILLSGLFGYSLTLFQKTIYKFSTTIKPSQSSTFYKYVHFNSYFMLNPLNFSYNLHINKNSIFEIFVDEFNDYDEIISVLAKNKKVIRQLKGLDEYEKNRLLIGLSKSFVIQKKIKGENQRMISFTWDNPKEGSVILAKAINETLKNVQKRLIINSTELLKLVEQEKINAIKQLNYDLTLAEKKIGDKGLLELEALREQLALANEINIVNSSVPVRDLTKALSTQRDSLHYLDGSKVISKKIKIILNRSQDQKKMLRVYDRDYERIYDQYLKINAYDLSEHKNHINVIKADKYKDWIQYNLLLGDIKKESKSILIIFISLLIGTLLGVIIIFITNASKNRSQ